MAQTSLREFYSVRRKRGLSQGKNGGSIKRRKLTEGTRLDIPSLTEQSDPCQTEQPLPTLHISSSSTNNKSNVETLQSQTQPNPPAPASRGVTLVRQTKKPTKSRAKSQKPASKRFSALAKPSTPTHSPIKQHEPEKHTLPLENSKDVVQSQPQSSAPVSRGATLVCLAKERMASKSPVKNSQPPANKKYQALAEPSTPSLSPIKQLNPGKQPIPTFHFTGSTSDAKQEKSTIQLRSSSRIRSSRKATEEVTTQLSSKKNRTPAYKRFHALAEPSPPPATSSPTQSPVKLRDSERALPLPYNYQVLLEKFRNTDTVVSMLQKRNEICTFSKLKKAVQEMTRKQFEQRNLAQMKTVFPTAYVFRQEKNIPGNYDRSQYSKYQLTVECNTNSEGTADGDNKKQLGPSVLIERRKVFQASLTSIVKTHHKKFLSKLNPPLDIPDEKVMRWHPAFKLDSTPEVEESELPKPPVTETYMTAQDVLRATQGQLPPRVEAALANVAASSSKEDKEEQKKKEPAKPNPVLKGVSEALLDRIRAKEAAKAELQITRDPVKEKQLEMMSRLPDFVRILRNYFVVEKKAALPWDDVVQKLSDSHPSGLPTDRVEEHLMCLSDLVPKWINVVNVRKRKYVKVDKKSDLKQVTAKLKDARKALLTNS